MDWAAADRRHDPASVEGRVFAGIQGLAPDPGHLLALRSGTSLELLDVGDRHVLAYRRRHPRSGPLVALASFSDDPVDGRSRTAGRPAAGRPARDGDPRQRPDGHADAAGLGARLGVGD